MQGVKRALDYGYSLWEMGIYEAATVQAPQFSLSSGTYNGTQNVSISSNTKGVEIRYTTDGSTPVSYTHLHQQLMEQKGFYADLYNSQFEQVS